MRILEPFYYEKFKCVGSKCIDTCCRGWNIKIDKNTFLKYRKVEGKFGERLNNSIKIKEQEDNIHEYGEFILDGLSCPLLNKENLCDVFINLGEESLCDTCTYYPRTCISINSENIEKNLGLSCPEVARILVENKGNFEFILKDREEEKLYINNIIYNCDESLYEMLWECRSFAIEIVQLSDLPLFKRLILLILLEGKLQKLIDKWELSNYGQVLDSFARGIPEFASMGEINDINNYVKLYIISTIINQEFVVSPTVKDLFRTLVNLFEGKTSEQIQEELKEKEKKFNLYIKEKEYIFENYMVYLLYKNFMQAIIDANVHEKIVIIMIEYAVMKLLLMVRWIYNNEKLNDDDFINILYSVSRTLEHSKVLTQIYEWIVEEKLDTPGYLTTLIY